MNYLANSMTHSARIKSNKHHVVYLLNLHS